ncbi:M1 family metallopeptidase [Flavisolibacter tropicus]|uniref:Peptidase M1 n=1 Tax=Flavisolibacter tropicus TaxID=1492898 RepID=A0A172TUC5_9BACT|nr:M1 family metallopeptidase [Flavisolibacter tropicus]ANE50689.1 peptidase M1 [Flavisolibacter tropicus]
MKHLFFSFLLLGALSASAQPDRWQQRVKYTMKVDMDVQSNQFTGKQKLEYWNNSPDTLKRVFYHLYWNAFQPNSMMDVRSRRQGTIVLRQDRNGRDIVDWDGRVQDRIANLSKENIGYQKILTLKMDGRPQKFNYHETILEVVLDRPILPKSKVTFDMDWEGQVPEQIRRSGRDNPSTGVRYTMTQWYPKMSEYDYEGWHPTPYVAREFYGVWGDYDVTIKIDKSYVLGGSGNLQNPNSVGYGYEEKGAKVTRPAGDKLTWHFNAPNVHDFAWAADPEYKHISRKAIDGITINVLYNGKPTQEAFDNLSPAAKADYKNDYNNYVAGWDAQWEAVADAAVTVYPFIKAHFGAYPYKQYSFIHGGDGGMEYPNCTMIVGPGLGTAFHEWMHTWYQMMLGTNESLYPWMDEGFTEYATNLVEEYYRQQVVRKNLANNPTALRRSDSTFQNSLPLYQAPNYGGYLALAKSGKEEPLTTHADHYNTNYAYTNAAYNKGAVFMEQLGYIIGAPARDRVLLDYYRQWHFKHPNVNDFMRIAEKQSNMQLDWYRMYWVNTTKKIDYGIDSLYEQNGATNIRLRRVNEMPMPIDVKVTFKDGTSEWHYIPMYLMFGAKPAEEGQSPRTVYESWKWTHPTYEIQTKRKLSDITTVEIDPSQRMADIDRKNNKLELKW